MRDDRDSIKVKLLSNTAKLPTYGTKRAAGADLYADEKYDVVIEPGEWAAISTGVSLDVSHLLDDEFNLEMHIRPRSGLSFKYGIDVLGGVVDSDYTGEIKVMLINHGKEPFVVERGDKIAQMVVSLIPYPISFKQVSDLPSTERGDKGFGSTGRK